MVDDDRSSIRLAQAHLRKAGYTAHAFDNGPAALKVLNRERAAIVLTDLDMPGLDGLALCRAVRKSDFGAEVYLVLVTAHRDPDCRLSGFEAGADDYLVKPYNPSEMLARVQVGARLLTLIRTEREARKRAEEAAVQLEEAHAQLYQADKMASIGQLAAGVAHEINNPIGFISSNLSSLGHYMTDLKSVIGTGMEVLKDCAEECSGLGEQARKVLNTSKKINLEYLLEDVDDLVRESQEGTQRVRQIVADLRDFSHVDTPDIQEEDINRLVDKTINVAWNELKYKADVVRQYGEVPPVPCYGGKLGQVFLNLLVNAAQAITDRGAITIRTGHAQEMAWVEVEDAGSGISEDNLGRIFEPFFTTKEVGKGTGMGLHLAYKIVKAHGGSIKVRSHLGQGTVFRVEVPLTGPLRIREAEPAQVT